ncbi:MAG TPA: glutathione S-transferase family protein [Kofleriaceae bacterium]|jgi:glutathione S-transferase
MSITFYYAPMSTASITELVIEELGIPVEKVKMDLRAGDTKKPDYLKLDPNGRVPCIVHDGTPIWESAAITIYLGELFGTAKKLWPEAGPRRGEAMKWVVWTNVSLGEAMYRRGHSGDWVAPEMKHEKMHAQATADVGKLLGILDAALAGKQFLLGEYTLADAHVCSIVDWIHHSKIDFSTLANVTAWVERCHARPAAKKLMADQK